MDETMCRLWFPNGDFVETHIWNTIDINNYLKNN